MLLSLLYIILFISLYIGAISLGGILHIATDSLILTKLEPVNSIATTAGEPILRLFLAALIVSFPIFLFLFLTLKKWGIEGLITQESRVKAVLVYITFAATFLIMVGQLIGELDNFLGGTATVRSLAHLGVTFLVAGPIFLYLLNNARNERVHHQ